MNMIVSSYIAVDMPFESYTGFKAINI